jgi:diphthamide biosynthesis protein 7
LQSSRLNDFVLASGSYDEVLRLWDTRALARPLVSVPTGGGLWRIKWHPHSAHHVAVAGMHNGFHVFEFGPGLDGFSVAPTRHDHYTEHASLAYGVDWHAQKPSLLATCAFYDHSLHLWQSPLLAPPE